MILRRFMKHVSDQNWFAVGLDVVVVITGIFLGMQVTEWSDKRAFYKSETELLVELKQELEEAIRVTALRQEAYTQVAEASRRSLNFISRETPCTEKCWPVLVEFLHASQWLDVEIGRPTYDSMRRMGLPRNKAIVKAVETYLLEAKLNSDFFSVLPDYRSTVRQMVPLALQEVYWEKCYTVTEGAETYHFDCKADVSDDLVVETVAAIVENPKVRPQLREWAGAVTSVPKTFGGQNAKGTHAIKLITDELESRE